MSRFDSDDAYFVIVLIAVAVFVFCSLYFTPQFPQPGNGAQGERTAQTEQTPDMRGESRDVGAEN